LIEETLALIDRISTTQGNTLLEKSYHQISLWKKIQKYLPKKEQFFAFSVKRIYGDKYGEYYDYNISKDMVTPKNCTMV